MEELAVVPGHPPDDLLILPEDTEGGPAFQPHAVRDGNLITGQQQHSGAETARLVIEVLEEGGK